jgi:hemerythrin-like domain-containing protein
MQMSEDSRRRFLRLVAGTGVVLSAGGWAGRTEGAIARADVEEDEEDEISPAEDLMREHGVLDRVLLIYEEGERRLQAERDLDPAVLSDAAGIVRRFIEDYHERLEEQHLFPRFEKAGTLADLVAVLREQHAAGRRVTQRIQQLASAAALKAPDERRELGGVLRQFVRMYRPHAAREDTVLFPALRRVVSPHELGALGEQFEDEEHRLFGGDGFEKVVSKVAGLEERLGIADLAQFTPRA